MPREALFCSSVGFAIGGNKPFDFRCGGCVVFSTYALERFEDFGLKIEREAYVMGAKMPLLGGIILTGTHFIASVKKV